MRFSAENPRMSLALSRTRDVDRVSSALRCAALCCAVLCCADGAWVSLLCALTFPIRVPFDGLTASFDGFRHRRDQRGDSEGVIRFLQEFTQSQMFHMHMMHVKVGAESS